MTTGFNDLSHAPALDDSPFEAVEHPHRRAFLVALAITGSMTSAAEAAGVHRCTPYSRPWQDDEQFRAGLPVAEKISADRLAHAAVQRAVDGVRRPMFDRRSGKPLLHPDACECSHDRRTWHLKLERDAEDMEDRPLSERFYWGQCTHPDCEGCEAFLGEPVYEHEYSDRLLQFLLKSRDPEVYGDRLRIQGVLANVSMQALPDSVVARVAAGEDLRAVLVSTLEAGGADAEAVRKALPAGSSVGSRHSAGQEPGELVQDDPDPPAAEPPQTDDDELPGALPEPGLDAKPWGDEGEL